MNNNNKLIAGFMGWNTTDCDEVFTEPSGMMDRYTTAEMQWKTDWNWLMPVIIKCKESIDYCSDDNALDYHNIEDEMLSQLSIEDTYKAVVEFIKEYNDER